MMLDIVDISTWKQIRIGDYFDVAYGKFIPKGREGSTPFITTTALNNGIGRYVDIPPMYDGNCITVASDGSMGASFYQEKPFAAINIVSTLKPHDNVPLNRYNAQFLCTLLYQYGQVNFSWAGYKFSVERAREARIPLPVTPAGTPDWDYMESYMKQIEEKAEKNLEAMRKVRTESRKIDTSKWGEFTLNDLFVFEGIKQAKSQKMVPTLETIEINAVPYVVQSRYNNMVARYVDKEYILDHGEPFVKGNCIVLGVTLNAVSYQSDDFAASQVITARNKHLNKRTGIFIASILRSVTEKYDYQEKPGLAKYRATKIKLPVTPSGTPDWDYMESYMRRIEEKAEKNLTGLIRVNTKMN